jgi:hypothetical protein
MRRPDLPLTAALAVAALTGGALLVLGSGGWPGTLGVSAGDFCERFRSGIVKQPANTWSNLGFVGVGVAIGLRARRDRLRGEPADRKNRMTHGLLAPTLLAAAVTYLGPGSMAMHGSTTAWGGKADVLSMQLYICFLPAYALARLLRLSETGFAAAYLGLAIPAGTAILVGSDPGNLIFRGLVGASALTEVLVRWRRPELGGNARWLAAGVAAFAVAYAIWLPSRTGGPLCDPDSLIQGHAIWHLLCAASTGCFYLYARSERQP